MVWVVALALVVPVVLMAFLAVQVVEWTGKRTWGDLICEEMEELAHSAGDKLLSSTVAIADDYQGVLCQLCRAQKARLLGGHMKAAL